MTKAVYQTDRVTVYQGDTLEVLRGLDAGAVHCCVTSPPYWGLRDYGTDGQYGLESTPQEYVENMTAVFREVHRVLRDDGTLWLNIGDSYCGGNCGARDPERWPKQSRNNHRVEHFRKPSGTLKTKDLIGLPWMLAFALRNDGWYLRSDIIWHKPNPMPESVTDRPTKAHEYLFLLSKNERYYYEAEAIREPVARSQVGRTRSDPIGGASWKERGQHSQGGRYVKKGSRRTEGRDRGEDSDTGSKPSADNTRRMADKQTSGRMPILECGRDETRNRHSVWTVSTKPCPDAHFAVFPPALIEPCIKAGCPAGGVVLDPFLGSGTTALMALDLGCRCVGIDLSRTYLDDIALPRIKDAEAQGRLF